MPELPDITGYVEGLERKAVGRALVALQVKSPFLLRSVDPPLATFTGREVRAASRIGKRLVLSFDEELHLVIHLMIAGRLRWRAPKAKGPAGKGALAIFEFPDGRIHFTEAGTKRRASITAVRGDAQLRVIDRGGLEVEGASLDDFADRLKRENHTLKRSLTDPRLFSGIGNAYSDEILHRAQLSPLKTTARITAEEIERLFTSAHAVLADFTARIRTEVGDGFPETVTAFREDFAVHGRYKLPCPTCGSPVQRIRYADNETNYCARCQTEGRLLADRAMSRLLKGDWPKSLDELDF